MNKVVVRVPATSANLGPAFDCMGMALDIYNTVSVDLAQSAKLEITGEGEDVLSRGEDNLVYRAMALVYGKTGKPVPSVSLACHNEIPLRRGLGSSAAALVGGLVAANHLCGQPLSQMELLQLGCEVEKHPDNLAPALLGGCQIVVKDENGEFVTASVPIADGLKAVLFIPEFEMSTARARSILPPTVGREDAVFNLGRVALLVHSLSSGKRETMRVATQDRLHQPQRQQHMFPAMGSIFAAAMEAGALGVFLSGGGSTILALTSGKEGAIADAMTEAGAREGVRGKTRVARPNPLGAQVVG